MNEQEMINIDDLQKRWNSIKNEEKKKDNK